MLAEVALYEAEERPVGEVVHVGTGTVVNRKHVVHLQHLLVAQIAHFDHTPLGKARRHFGLSNGLNVVDSFLPPMLPKACAMGVDMPERVLAGRGAEGEEGVGVEESSVDFDDGVVAEADS